MTGGSDLDQPDRIDDVSFGRAADRDAAFSGWPEVLRDRFELYSYRGGATILSQNYPSQFADIVAALERLTITADMIRTEGGSKGPIAHHVDTLLPDERWAETRISADLHVKLHHAKQADTLLGQYVRKGHLDGHRIDFVSGKVAFDLEWNSKDQTYDRDLYAFSAFHAVGAIDVGIILTRGSSLTNDFFRSLGQSITKDGLPGRGPVFKKFGASTTWMGKLLYRLDAGRNGGCPVVAIGITPRCVSGAPVSGG